MAINTAYLDGSTPWTITSKLLSRENFRNSWDEDFEKNYKEVADKIADFLIKEIFSKLRNTLSDSYLRLPKSSAPLEFSCPMDITLPENARKIKQRAEGASELAPFKEWLDSFAKEETDQPNGVHRQSKFMFLSDKETDLDYFRERMSKIGRMVKEKISNTLIEFAKKESNAQLKHRVAWHRNAEKNAMFSSLGSFGEDNYVSVKIWLSSPSGG